MNLPVSFQVLNPLSLMSAESAFAPVAFYHSIRCTVSHVLNREWREKEHIVEFKIAALGEQ